MEALGAAGQQEAETEAARAGSGPAAEEREEEIDLSLDDIIKRNRKGQMNPKARGNRWRQPLKNRNPAYGNGRPRFRSWAPRNGQGPNRFQGGFRKWQYYRKPFWNRAIGPKPRAAIRPIGISPLNWPASAQQGKPAETTLAGSSDGAAAATNTQQQGPPTRVKRFRPLGPSLPGQRPFQLNRRPAFLQRQSRFSFNRGQTESNAEGKPSRMRRWQLHPNSGAVLTISVSNPQASQMNGPGFKRPFLRGRSTPVKMSHHQPKGVPLRFNFRAMANQTSLTLDERFSGLRNKGRFSALRNAGRMVTLP
ncbi:UAP56-interacting factor-like [Hemicordylus capensis]|uniref:UAP56-interacting factor-like n=1 Tax=Hemicordylus capensis TaxID=884348 RepID=UPI002304A91F|nr:UAP56-interacting factor-like [Hemicordylus capensis]